MKYGGYSRKLVSPPSFMTLFVLSPPIAMALSRSSRALSCTAGIKEQIESGFAEHWERLKRLRKDHGSTPLDSVSVDQVVGGMHGVPGILWEPSELDGEGRVRVRGNTLQQLRSRLPSNEDEPWAEGLLWLLMTGQIPRREEVEALRSNLERRHRECQLGSALGVMESMPAGTSNMARLSAGVLALQQGSKFNEAYSRGRVAKSELWVPALEDCLDIIAILPGIIAKALGIRPAEGFDASADWAQRLCRLLGKGDTVSDDSMRSFVLSYCGSLGGDPSAHTSHMIGSTLADPYLAFAAAINCMDREATSPEESELVRDFARHRLPDSPSLGNSSQGDEPFATLRHLGLPADWPLVAAPRSLGILSHFVIARAFRLPMEYPRSLTSASIWHHASTRLP